MVSEKYAHLIKTLSYEKNESGEFMTRMMGADLEGLNVSFAWGYRYQQGKWGSSGSSCHAHPYGEVLLFTGLDYSHPSELGAEISVGINGESRSITMPTFVTLPAGLPHGPLETKKAERPFGFLAVSTDGVHNLQETKPDNKIMTDEKLVRPFEMHDLRRPGSGNADFMNAWSGHEFPGFNLNFTWAFHSGVGPFHTHDPHVHPNDECLVFVGTDPERPDYLGAEIEIGMGTEVEPCIFNKPTVVIAPAGLVHCPLIVRKVERPYCFTAICLNNEHDTTWLGGDPVVPNVYALPHRKQSDNQ